MTFQFRPARRTEAKPLIGLHAQSGAGKTLSALLLARGFAGPTGKVGMIETESGRGEAYQDDPRVPGGYLVLPLRDDCSPVAFGEAIAAAEKEGLDALILDSASLEWIDGPHCVIAQAAANEAAGKRGMQIWRDPKMDHQEHFIVPMLRTPIPLVILCMRSRYPMEDVVIDGKKTQRRSTELEPYQSDTILFELFAHGWIDREHRFHGTKWTRDELRAVLRDNEPITLETGQRLAAWAKGGAVAPGAAQPSARAPLAGEAGVPFDSAAGAYRDAPGATYNLATGELTGPDGRVITRPATDVQGWIDALRAAATPELKRAVWTTLTVGTTAPWHQMTAADQKRLLAEKGRAL